MAFRKFVKVAGLMAGAYVVGKMVGTHHGAKVVMKKYADILPDEEVVIKLVDNALLAVTVTTKKAAK